MSLERELLGRAMSLIDYRYAPSEAVAVHREIQELLAQPEQEPVEDRIARWHKLGYEQGRKSALNEQEPVAWKVIDGTHGGYMFSRIKPTEHTYKYNEVIPLYTSPPKLLTPRQGLAKYKRGYARAELDLKREPLSESEIAAIWGDSDYEVAIVRAIEKAHGITGGGECVAT